MFEGLIDRIAAQTASVLDAGYRSGRDAKRTAELQRLQRCCAYYKAELKKARKRPEHLRAARCAAWQWRMFAWRCATVLGGTFVDQAKRLDAELDPDLPAVDCSTTNGDAQANAS